MNQSFDGYIVFSADLLTVQAQIAEKRGGWEIFQTASWNTASRKVLFIKPNRDSSVASEF